VSLPGLARRLFGRTRSTPDRDSVLAPTGLDEEFLRRLERLSLVARRPASGGIGGEHRSSARAPSTDFADYRPYMPGDDFRRIDWNAYGRLGHLYVKLTEAREQLSVQILVDASGSMDWGEPSKLDYARQLAAGIAYVGLARFDRVGITTLGETTRRFAMTRGRARFHELLEFLNATLPSGQMRMDAALAQQTLASGRRRGGGSRGGQAIVISDMLAPEGYQAGLDRLLRSGFEVVVLQTLSPQELEPDPGGDLELVDAESGELVEVSLTVETIAQYRERLERWCDDVRAFCTQRGIRYVRVSTATPFDELLLNTFRQELLLR
jgi:uncharacterized protein (DUF58 family)